jgi:nucleoside-diphosphate-sugar epimerase
VVKVLVLGAYGLIGREITRELLCRDIEVVGLGRSAARSRRLFPRAEWIGADLGELADPADWAARIDGVDGVVNAWFRGLVPGTCNITRLAVGGFCIQLVQLDPESTPKIG